MSAPGTAAGLLIFAKAGTDSQADEGNCTTFRIGRNIVSRFFPC
jgi:hypothetical protein